MRKRIGVCVLVAAALAAAGCGSQTEGAGTSQSGGAGTSQPSALEPTPLPDAPAATENVEMLRWDLPWGEPVTLDVARMVNFSDLEVSANMCEPLEFLTPDGGREPALATSIDAPNPTTYVINVRKGVQFWDGTELTAEDVAFSMNRILDPHYASFYAGLGANVKSITQTGQYQVTVKMKRPDVLYREALATPLGAVTEKKYTEEHGDSYGTPQAGVMCTGPYMFESWEPGASITLKRNPNWWDAKARKQYVNQVEFTFVTSAQTLTSALESGEIDGSFQIPPSAYTRLESSPEGQLLSGPSSEVYGFATLRTDGDVGNVKIRQAFQKLIDYQGYIESQLSGRAAPSRALMGPNTWAGAPDVYRAAYEKLPEPKQDLEAARKLIKESGIPHPKLKVATYQGLPQNVALVEQVQSAGAEVGLEIDLEALPLGQATLVWTSKKEREKYDLFMTETNADIPEAFEFYQGVAFADGPNNLSGWTNPKTTELFNQALAQPDPEKRAKLAVQGQTVLAEQLPWIPVIFPDFVAYLKEGLTGLKPSLPYVLYTSWIPEVGAP